MNFSYPITGKLIQYSIYYSRILESASNVILGMQTTDIFTVNGKEIYLKGDPGVRLVFSVGVSSSIPNF